MNIDKKFLENLNVPKRCWNAIDIQLTISKTKTEKTFTIITGKRLKFKPFLICNN